MLNRFSTEECMTKDEFLYELEKEVLVPVFVVQVSMSHSISWLSTTFLLTQFTMPNCK